MTGTQPEIQIITLTKENLGKVQMFCGHSPTYRQGYQRKTEWLRERLKEGMHYTLLQVRGRNAGMIEYIPGEFTWRGIDAQGNLFIHCFWVLGRNRKHGYGQRLLQTCLDDAKGTNGVAVVVSKAHWLPTPKIFLNNGFELVDQVLPFFVLLVKRNKPDTPLPRFKRTDQDARQYGAGLMLFHSDQCPYMQNMPAIVQQVGERLNIPVNIIHLENAQTAQNSPCIYGVLGVFFNGELLTYRPKGTKQLLELLEPKLAGSTG